MYVCEGLRKVGDVTQGRQKFLASSNGVKNGKNVT